MESYGGGHALIGGLLGGGLGGTIGGIGGKDSSILLGALGGTLGGAFGSFAEPRSNGLSVLGGALGGTLGAVVAIKYKEQLERISPFKTTTGVDLTKDLTSLGSQVLNNTLDIANSTMKMFEHPLDSITQGINATKDLTDPSKLVAGAVGVITNPLGLDANDTMEAFKHPIDALTQGVDTTDPSKAIHEIGGAIKNPFAIFGSESDLASDKTPITTRQLPDLGSTLTKPLNLATEAAGTAVNMASGFGLLKLLFQPVSGIASGGILAAFGGGIGSYLGSWAFDAIPNLIL